MVREKTNKQNPDYVLAYSSDPVKEKKCIKCGNSTSQCTCAREEIKDGKLAPKIRLEKKGRGGKSVTVLFKLPRDERILKDLCTSLKRSIGTGGTYYLDEEDGVIEIQGEWQEKVLALISRYRVI